jgi:hypothetical protein
MRVATNAPKWPTTETQKLRERVEPFVEPGERVVGAFLAQSGPRTYSRLPRLVPFTFVLELVLEWRHRGERRTWVTIAVTDRSITIFENKWSWRTGGKSYERSLRFLRRYDDRSVLGDTGESWGDDWIAIDGERYWVNGVWLDEARKLSRLVT